MYSSLFSLIIALALGGSALSESLCYTRLGRKSVQNVPTTTYTLTVPVTVTTKSTSTPAVTQTTTQGVTSKIFRHMPFHADILVSTTKVVTVTATSTSTTVTTTQTTSTSTTTVPTPAGFTPVSQENGYVPKIKGRDVYAPQAQQRVSGNSVAKSPNSPIFNPKLYPNAVYCVKILKPVTTKTVTLTASQTQTSTVTKTTSTTTTLRSTTTTTKVVPKTVTGKSSLVSQLSALNLFQTLQTLYPQFLIHHSNPNSHRSRPNPLRRLLPQQLRHDRQRQPPDRPTRLRRPTPLLPLPLRNRLLRRLPAATHRAPRDGRLPHRLLPGHFLRRGRMLPGECEDVHAGTVR